MKPSIRLLLLAGAVACSGSTLAAEMSSINYQAQDDKCGTLPGSDQAACHDAVGMRNSASNQSSASNPAIGSLQSADRCAQLN